MTAGDLAARLPIGRTFLHPAFDYLAIGGGLSLLVTGWFALGGALPVLTMASGAVLLLLLNLSHFAASTVRLYSKPGAFRDLPFLTMGLPLATLAVLALALRFADQAGAHLMNLYLTWSPYHYAAQAYGLALMYSYRSGATLDERDRRLLRIACLAPFVYAFVKGPTAGIDWFVPASLLQEPNVALARVWLLYGLGAAAILLPPGLYASWAIRGRGVPLISLLIMLSNAWWWIGLLYLQAFAWATIFHALQYLAIVMIFHVKERVRRPQSRGWLRHALAFYGACVALAYGLFKLWPYAFVSLGFGLAESMLLVVATVNVHHFIVDAYIWKFRRDPNYAVVVPAAA